MVRGAEACGAGGAEQEMKVMIALIWNPCTKLLYFARVSDGPYQESRSELTAWKNQVKQYCAL